MLPCRVTWFPSLEAPKEGPSLRTIPTVRALGAVGPHADPLDGRRKADDGQVDVREGNRRRKTPYFNCELHRPPARAAAERSRTSMGHQPDS